MVGIVVDQLRTDYIEQLQDLFGTKGFRMLMHDGVYMRDVDFGATGLDANSGAAAVLTGSFPAYTGVPAAMVYDADLRAMRPALVMPGVGTAVSNNSFTPEALRLSTVADELAVASDGNAAIYSVAAEPQQAVILAGHAATGAVWINNTSGLWATSSYYGGLPTAAQRANLRSAMTHRVDTMVWRPLQSTARIFQEKGRRSPLFNYKYTSSDRDVYRKVTLTPGGNAAVTDVAIDLLGQMAADPTRQGMLSVAYTVAPYRYASGTAEAETTDVYLRLDAQIGRLIEAVDRTYGRGNAVIWLTSTGYSEAAAVEDKRFRMPGGEFSARRARSLLNSYLTARHGTADYVAAIRNGNVYLDTKAIEGRNLDPLAIAEEARLFLARMSGVEQTFTRGDILAGSNAETRALALGYDPKSGGDVLLLLAPGWSMNEDETGSVSHAKPMRQVPAMTPSMILAPGLTAQQIDTPVDAATLAPTVAGILRIRSPNGARRRPLPLIH